MFQQIFPRQNFTLAEKVEFITAFFQIFLFILALLGIIAVLLLIMTTLCFVSLLSIRYEGIIDALLVLMGSVIIAGLSAWFYFHRR